MALYRRDYEYEKANKVIESLDENDERDRAILYYIRKNKEWSDRKDERLREYQEIFDAMSKFISPRKPTVYG